MDQTDNILAYIKSNVGINEDIKVFDEQILESINMAFIILFQEGVGQQTAPFICDDTSKWSDFITNNKVLELSKTFVYKKVQLAFDPPQNGNLMQSSKDILDEVEWRLNFDHELNEEGDS